jgi:hypothetical protein|tara:strand:+ start:150 stop:263 length:114 start_codon:yes stop_codon:yes gene_type:complete
MEDNTVSNMVWNKVTGEVRKVEYGLKNPTYVVIKEQE